MNTKIDEKAEREAFEAEFPPAKSYWNERTETYVDVWRYQWRSFRAGVSYASRHAQTEAGSFKVIRRPLLVSGMLTVEGNILIDSESSPDEQRITLWHEALHKAGLTDEQQVEAVARKLAAFSEPLTQAEAGGGVPDTYELYSAVREGAQNNAAEAYFSARPERDTLNADRVFNAGFQRGFDACNRLNKALPPTQPTASVSRDSGCEVNARIDADNVIHIQGVTYDYSKDKIVIEPKYGQVPLPARDELQAALQKLTEQERESAGVPAAEVQDCGEAGHAEGKCGNRRCLPSQPQPDEPVRGAPKQAYYEIHEPPHCPTCGCGLPASEPDRVKVLEDALVSIRRIVEHRQGNAAVEIQRIASQALAGDAS